MYIHVYISMYKSVFLFVTSWITVHFSRSLKGLEGPCTFSEQDHPKLLTLILQSPQCQVFVTPIMAYQVSVREGNMRHPWQSESVKQHRLVQGKSNSMRRSSHEWNARCSAQAAQIAKELCLMLLLSFDSEIWFKDWSHADGHFKHTEIWNGGFGKAAESRGGEFTPDAKEGQLSITQYLSFLCFVVFFASRNMISKRNGSRRERSFIATCI